MDAKRKKSGFTLVELLTVIGIIAILLGLLVPSLSMVRKIAKETKQKAQLTTIGLALTAFKNDYGDYPPFYYPLFSDYCGAQKLAEALLGWDLLGFHPDSAWRADGYDGGLSPEGWLTYDPGKTRDIDGDGILDTLDERRGPYLELATTNAFRLSDLFGAGNTGDLAEWPYVICDVFGVKKITLANGETVKAGTPILYYRANTSSKTLINDEEMFDNNIYNIHDNGYLVSLGRLKDGTLHPLMEPSVFYSMDGGVVDPKASTPTFSWPYRPDSYILISAGADGLYGTTDDITNFGN